ncbi:universal stress protein [Halomicrobium urmianum]|uniref:universal stress protein n=1 Tax=Halomicrobium urmianum TaxID=1586233 RepID=UPI001CD9E427|nr:universal stress protein [Halomicrobium urmianum]
MFDRSARDADVPEEIAEFAGDPTRITAVRRAVDYLDDRGVSTEVIEGSADAAERILTVAEERDVDSIVMGGRKRSPIEQSLFSSVTQSVVRNTDRPVVVTGGSGE